MMVNEDRGLNKIIRDWKNGDQECRNWSINIETFIMTMLKFSAPYLFLKALRSDQGGDKILLP